MSSVSIGVRRTIHTRSDGDCEYCGLHVGLRAGTIDHYLPRALGGTDALRNLRWACITCNGLKADMHPGVWELTKPKKVDQPKTKHEIRCELISSAIKRSMNNGKESVS